LVSRDSTAGLFQDLMLKAPQQTAWSAQADLEARG